MSLRSFCCVRCLYDDDDDTEIRPHQGLSDFNFAGFTFSLILSLSVSSFLHQFRIYSSYVLHKTRLHRKITRVQDIIFSLPVCVAACGRTKNEFYESNEFQISNWPWSSTPSFNSISETLTIRKVSPWHSNFWKLHRNLRVWCRPTQQLSVSSGLVRWAIVWRQT